MIRILIADDHAVVRAGLKQFIEKAKDMIVTAEAKNGQEALNHIWKEAFDVVILDIKMPGRDGVDILRQIKAEKPKLPVLILSMHPEEQYATRVLKAGASGYLSKESPPEELRTAIRKVHGGGKYVSPHLAELFALDLEKDSEKPPHEMLSDREFQVMCMIAQGMTLTAIADELSLSVKTIGTYRTRILEKMDMKSNSEVTRYALKHQLVD